MGLDELCNSEVEYGSCPVAERLRARVGELEAELEEARHDRIFDRERQDR